ncbi:hypothetical protein Y032_0760g2123 [Ancylostoma ceylanicum]|nr:hypothetical protein Y032_0760g2123 [Ancylostoma ceylanicum]
MISKDEEEPLRLLQTPPPSLIEQSRNAEKHVTFSEPRVALNNHQPPKIEKEPLQASGSESPRASLQSGMTAYFTAQESLSDNGIDEESEIDLDATLRDIGDENFDMRDVT